MTKPQLFINTDIRNSDGSISENWVSVDINPDVNITVKDKIKDSKDVGKVFTAYTNQFKLPASKTNNRVFKRFANNNIYDGFDPRRKYDAIIKLNGIDFKKGYIKLNDVSLINNEAKSYSIQFFGEVTSLKDILSSAKLKDLRQLSHFRYENSIENVIKGFDTGFDVEISSGTREQALIRVTSPSTTGGALTLTLNGDTYNMSISPDLDYEQTLREISDFINFYTVGQESGVIVPLNYIIIVSDTTGNKVDASISVGSTGVSASILTLVQGEPDGTNAVDGVTTENINGDFKYPLLTHTKGIELTSQGLHRILSVEEKEDGYTVGSEDRINFADLKPSMKIKRIFEAIEYQYPQIRFNKDWLFGGPTGIKQISSIVFTSGATSAGAITVSLNGDNYIINISIGDENAVTAQVASAINSISGYIAGVLDDNAVIIQSETYRDEAATSLVDTDSTGISFTTSTITQGYLSQATEGGSTLDEVYMWLHNVKGYIGYQTSTGSVERNTNDRTFVQAGNGAEEGEWASVTGELRPMINTTGGINQFGTIATYVSFKGTIFIENITGGGSVTIEVDVRRDGYEGTIHQYSQTTALSTGESTELDFEIIKENESALYIGHHFILDTRIIVDSSVVTYEPRMDITKREYTPFPIPMVITNTTASYGFTSDSFPQTVTNLSYIDPRRIMPDMKIIDFLSDIFKTYNLVAFEERLDDNSYLLNVKSLDQYLDDGTQYDITKYVDISKSTVSRISPYNIVEYNFADPKTFLAINQKEITGDSFGNVEFNVNNFRSEESDSSNSLLFDGGTYKVEPKFEKMMYERLLDQANNDDYSQIQWGWFVADNKGDNFPNPVIGKPLLHYIVNRPCDVNTIEWDNGTTSSNTYNAPSNIDESGLNTMHFNEEFSEWDRDRNPNSIFNNFHSKYINSIYSAYAKRFKTQAYLPPAMIARLNLSDTLVINRVSYIIDSMDININKSLTKFDLLRATDVFKTFEGTPVEETETNLSFRIVTLVANETLELPYTSTGTYDGIVDWGDGETSINTWADRTHTYAVAGEYVVEIQGQAREILFGQPNTIAYKELLAFGADSSLNRLDFNDLGSGFDMSNVSDKPKFRAFSKIQLLLNDTDGYVNGIEDWDVSNVINMKDSFSESDFNQAIGGWDVSNVTTMASMFAFNNSFNKPLSLWDVGLVTSMEAMFAFNNSFNQDLSLWNTSNVTNMKQMFRDAESYNQDMSQWDFSNVTQFDSMFYDAKDFNQDVSNWDVSNVSSMDGVFYGANSFNQDLSSWDFTGTTSMNFFLGGPFHSFSTTNYSKLLIAVDNAGESNGALWCPDVQYTSSGVAARASLVSKGWTVTDAGLV